MHICKILYFIVNTGDADAGGIGNFTIIKVTIKYTFLLSGQQTGEHEGCRNAGEDAYGCKCYAHALWKLFSVKE